MNNNVKSTIYLIILIDLCCSISNEISVRLQKGSYSNISLCKSSTPIYERSARSAIECFTFCQILLGNNCKSFKYRWVAKSCSLHKDVIHYDYNENVHGTCKGYQIMPDCPVGFKYLLEGNKCIKMLIGSWDWYTGRQLCNSLHPRSHPVIVDLKNDSLLFSRFFEKEILPNCPNTLDQGLYTYWSAGFSPYINGLRQQFQWSPFPGVVQPLKATTPWNPGEPNSYSYSSDNCIQSLYERTLDDFYCSFRNCILCEIEMF